MHVRLTYAATNASSKPLMSSLPLRVLRSAKRVELEAEMDVSTGDLLRRLAEHVKAWSKPAVSGFQVGAAGLTTDGDVVCGVNIEVAGCNLSGTVHAEQFVVASTFHNRPSVRYKLFLHCCVVHG